MTTLEKIRAEIEQLQDEWFKETDGWWCYEKALQIIDKYAEQEPIENYEYEIECLQKRLDIAEYDKERLKEKIKALEQEPTVSIETYQQVCKERDIAIEQLHELGYEFGQKIKPCDDVVNRQAVIKCLERGDTLSSIDHRLIDKIKRLPPVRPQEQTREEQTLLRKWRDNRGISIEDFEDAMNALQEPQENKERSENNG